LLQFLCTQWTITDRLNCTHTHTHAHTHTHTVFMFSSQHRNYWTNIDNLFSSQCSEGADFLFQHPIDEHHIHLRLLNKSRESIIQIIIHNLPVFILHCKKRMSLENSTLWYFNSPQSTKITWRMCELVRQEQRYRNYIYRIYIYTHIRNFVRFWIFKKRNTIFELIPHSSEHNIVSTYLIRSTHSWPCSLRHCVCS
jgi:hypothetical protein